MNPRSMIHGLSGELKDVGLNHIVIGVGGVSYKVYIPVTQEKLPKVGELLEIYTYLHAREGGIDLYGFFEEQKLGLFEKLVSVSGVGPKSAMAILSVASADKLMAAIAGGEPDFLRRSSGVGKKTAERIIVELRDKMGGVEGGSFAALAESDRDVYEALVGLGYQKRKVEEVLREIDSSITDVRDRLKEALKKIKG
ncbi:MAG: Holliday junction branch migration protein RuvA [Candidatus Colwellbacteria bacterium CG10_big_fil_rev_8_21_14_0_10_42_22]|uniref:Holliday junction branch migration complex subunit RuvA n=1 Tax=Candidatus Colwellbacteria bacterium CG10_big_fil_rev_8_21_14_0_10_42_22 TaxID=1974540 RepID=A0A2H0VI15_9BACT|nr:MAG: Holliday junction branch migration protein RuvA [Candidatus Colwellbacteria bacterium CG10_big_fil_rev_8_21_14_0_10_42_22]